MERLDPRVRYVWLLKSVFSAVLFGAVGGFVGAFVFDEPLLAAAGTFAVAGVLGGVHAIYRYGVWGFALRDDDLYIERGVLTQVRTMVPFVRVQHVDTQRSPLERAFSLSRVVVYTAGSRQADVSIPGLTPERATALQQRLRDLAVESESEDAV
jgi:hypothetical protein